MFSIKLFVVKNDTETCFFFFVGGGGGDRLQNRGAHYSRANTVHRKTLQEERNAN